MFIRDLYVQFDLYSVNTRPVAQLDLYGVYTRPVGLVGSL
jgi:hypothetical protein